MDELQTLLDIKAAQTKKELAEHLGINKEDKRRTKGREQKKL